jgi:hypothetical protein
MPQSACYERTHDPGIQGAPVHAPVHARTLLGVISAYPWLLGVAAAWIRPPACLCYQPARSRHSTGWNSTATGAARPRPTCRVHHDLGCGYDAALALLSSGEEEALGEALDICQDLGAVATSRPCSGTRRVQPPGPADQAARLTLTGDPATA